MIRGGEISKGTVLLNKGTPYLIVDREFVTPGKGAAFARVKMKNLRDGSVLTQTIKTSDLVEDATVNTHIAQFQYHDGENFVFMDTKSFEQIPVSEKTIADKRHYLREGDTYDIVVWEEEAIDVKIPVKMIFVVTEENIPGGETMSGTTKPVRTETGLVVRVPLFIKLGEKIMVNTESCEYQERVNS